MREVASAISVNILLSEEFCHWKVAVPYPVAGAIVNAEVPLMHSAGGVAVDAGLAGKLVITDVAVLIHSPITLCAVQV